MKIKAKRLSDTAKLPTYGSEKAACADLYANLRVSTIKEINDHNILISILIPMNIIPCLFLHMKQ